MIMKLKDLLENNAVTSIGDTEITSITDDTRKIKQGSLFFCIKGGNFDGHNSAAEMLEKGAAAVVCEYDLGLGNKQIITPDTRQLYGEICASWFGHPEKAEKVILSSNKKRKNYHNKYNQAYSDEYRA